MTVRWLHVSDFHFKSGDPYDRDVVLEALIASVADFRERGRQPDLIFATGDIAHSGRESEYKAATEFFDALCTAAGVDKRNLFIVPGNHDVDRTACAGLVRTLTTREEANTYFSSDFPSQHIARKQRNFVGWYNDYFRGVRIFPHDSTCGPVELVDIRGCKVGILPINSALFCEDDQDHEKLWIGRRCLAAAVDSIRQLQATLSIALIHHPLHWLHEVERANISTKLQDNVDLILRGHLHETNIDAVAGVTGEALHMAAGAAYQTSPDYASRLAGVA